MTRLSLLISLLWLTLSASAFAAGGESPRSIRYAFTPPAPAGQTVEQAGAKSMGCLTCHSATDHASMHANEGVILGCADCHGGNVRATKPMDAQPGDAAYRAALDQAHVQPRYPETWHFPRSANPKRTYTLLNKEAPEFIRFTNPSDYRVAREACGACHLPIIQAAERSLMATGAMLWGGAAYNNGILPFKNYITGEGYTREGEPAKIMASVVPTAQQTLQRGLLPFLLPLPHWAVIPPADPFRVFERGGRNIITQFPEIGNPNSLGQLQRLEEPGRPDIRQSNRGPGTGLRIAVPVLNIHKTRLNDPFTWFMGTNDQPGDYRNSGCSSCHVVYANDRDPRHSGPYAQYGHDGKTITKDPTIPKDESGHPLKHVFTSAIPTSQCMICHMHQPNIFLNSMLGYTMWDYESDAQAMWPEKQKYPSNAEMFEILQRNPEEAAVRGKWGDIAFLKQVWDMNPTLKDTQFADYHGHGWNFRAIFKRDRKGNLLDAVGAKVENDDPQKFKKSVHMSSIHVDLGMHCVDCHFSQDSHGNGHIYGEVAAAIEITCADCHGTVSKYPTLRTSGPAAQPGGNDLSLMRLSDGRPRFEWRGGKLYQRASLDPNKEWEMSLVKDTVDPEHQHFNAKAARAKLMGKDHDLSWGPGIEPAKLAHSDDEMACFTCHLSWTTSCAGCHLPIQANWKTDLHHFEGGETRNYATYNPQVARDDMFQLGRHGTIKGGIIAPIRSTSALILSSTNINREIIYAQQPPIAASGFSSQAFAPHYPHTERKEETKTCTDCHLSRANDNNAWMAQLLLHGTNFVNFVGYNAWLGEATGVRAVQVTEWDEPQAVIGSYLHRYAYPDYYKAHEERRRELPTSHANGTGNPATCVQLRGEYLYAAEGKGGMRVYDVASVANKGVSQRILSAPFGPWGHNTHIPSKNATCVAMPTNQPIHVPRNEGELMRVTNQEQPFHPIYRYALISDAEEGLIVTDDTTLTDGDPLNNFLTRAATWNENGVLKGAKHLTIAGHIVYVAADAGVVVLDLDDPLKPRLVTVIPMTDARATAVQFRYLFVTTARGLEVIDVTLPQKPKPTGALVPMKDAQRVYLARTYAYVAAKTEGLVIIDVENPEKPFVYERFTSDGSLNDARDVIVGTTNATAYAYVADGVNGLKVVHLTAPDRQPNFYGFTPEPKPILIATHRTPSPALSLSKGLDRDRGVDETGHQMAVFGRIGSRPFTLAEQRKLYLDDKLQPWFVTDEVRMSDFRPGPTGARPKPGMVGGPPNASQMSPGKAPNAAGEHPRPSASPRGPGPVMTPLPNFGPRKPDEMPSPLRRPVAGAP
jgi:hypothetical protein